MILPSHDLNTVVVVVCEPAAALPLSQAVKLRTEADLISVFSWFSCVFCDITYDSTNKRSEHR